MKNSFSNSFLVIHNCSNLNSALAILLEFEYFLIYFSLMRHHNNHLDYQSPILYNLA